jgi:LmbE family N-acetylglucosaminyl deacetylase
MCITAHPDDEAGAFGGALLMAKASGVVTSVLCMTAGAAGSYRADGQTDAELAEARRAEFAAACEALGVTHSVILNYPDGGLHLQPFLPMVGDLVAYIRRERPHVVLSFGGDGGVNLHRDHTMISLAATAAFHWAGRSGFYAEQLTGKTTPWAPQKLYYTSTPFISTRDPEAAHAGARVPASLSLELGDWKERKMEAFLEHGTQRGVLERVRASFEEKMNEEGYLLVAARTPVYPDDALFAGVVPE